MKTLIFKIVAAALVAIALASCGTARQESAMEWLARQPNNTR
jgi:hypothetical protein